MLRKTGYLLTVLLILGIVLVVSAQDEPAVYTFESGVQFTIPEGLTIDDSGEFLNPTIWINENTILEVVDPEVLARRPGIFEMPLDEVLDYLLSTVEVTATCSDDNSRFMELLDGREAFFCYFVDPDEIIQTMVVLRMSDGRTGAVNMRTLENPMPEEHLATLSAIVESFDVSTDMEAVLVAGLSQEIVYESGVHFSYPDYFALLSDENPPVQIGIEGVIFITMVDPAAFGIPAGAPMEDVIYFVIARGSTTAEADDFEPLDIGGREAVFASAPSDPFYQTVVLVRFTDETVGIMDAGTATEPTDELMLDIRRIAASFDSAEIETEITQTDIERANTLFEEGMIAHDDGDYETALDLFTQAIDLNPDWAYPFYYRAVCYYRLGRLDNAIADYRQVLELEPGEVQVRGDIIDMYVLQGNVEAAVAEFELYVEAVGESSLPPDHLAWFEVLQEVANGGYVEDYYYYRTVNLSEIGLYDDALESNQVALDHNPDNVELYAQRGLIYIFMEQYPDAIVTLTDGLEVELHPMLFYYRGIAHSENLFNDLNAIVNGVLDYQCFLLLADDTVTQEQLNFAQRAIDTTIISDDSYAPITDPADCKP